MNDPQTPRGVVERNVKVGNWHAPKKDDPDFVTEGGAIEYARQHSLKRDNDLTVWCVWVKQSNSVWNERFLILNGQLWQPA